MKSLPTAFYLTLEDKNNKSIKVRRFTMNSFVDPKRNSGTPLPVFSSFQGQPELAVQPLYIPVDLLA